VVGKDAATQFAATLKQVWQRTPPGRRDSGSASASAIPRFRWSLQMLATPKGLSDEKEKRMMIALREGRTLRSFGVKPLRHHCFPVFFLGDFVSSAICMQARRSR
jgi:hypothetical protein